MYYAYMTVAFLAIPFGMLFYLYKLAKLESEQYVKDLEQALNDNQRLATFNKLAKLESERLKPRVRIMKRGHNQFVAQIYLVNKMIWESKPSPTSHHAMQRAEGKIDYEKWR